MPTYISQNSSVVDDDNELRQESNNGDDDHYHGDDHGNDHDDNDDNDDDEWSCRLTWHVDNDDDYHGDDNEYDDDYDYIDDDDEGDAHHRLTSSYESPWQPVLGSPSHDDKDDDDDYHDHHDDVNDYDNYRCDYYYGDDNYHHDGYDKYVGHHKDDYVREGRFRCMLEKRINWWAWLRESSYRLSFSCLAFSLFFCVFLATLGALHFTPTSRSVVVSN